MDVCLALGVEKEYLAVTTTGLELGFQAEDQAGAAPEAASAGPVLETRAIGPGREHQQAKR